MIEVHTAITQNGFLSINKLSAGEQVNKQE